MVFGIVGKSWNLILDNKANKIKDEYVHYDGTDKGYMYTVFDSNVQTDYKEGADMLPLPEVRPYKVAVIKDIPFEVNCPCKCNNSSSNGGTNP